MEKGQVSLLIISHVITDSYGGFIAVLLPFFVARWGLSLAEAGGLVTAFFATSNFAQSFFGWMTDRRGGRWLLAGGPLIVSVFIGSLGAVPSFGWMLPWVILGGLGAAAFHPPAAKWARHLGRKRATLTTSIFIMAGLLGFAVGPLEILAAIDHFGLEGSYLSMIPGVAVAFIVFKYAADGEEKGAGTFKPPSLSVLARAWPSLSSLWTIVVLRSLTNNAFAGFLPILMEGRGVSAWVGGAALSIYLTGCAAGGVIGGYLGDRMDRRRMIDVSLILSVVTLGAFLATRGWISIVFLVAGGILLMFSNAITLVMAQEMHPEQSGLVSGLMMGVAFGTSSLLLVVIGAAADAVGMSVALGWVTGAPLIAAWLAFRLPRSSASPRKDLSPAENLSPGGGS
jgi:FSR family fosmidomycin resistance protein-like MFS transporter